MAWPVANAHSPPEPNQLELALIGPGYGESALLHIGNGDWILVDSCMTVEGAPAALSYLESMGIDVARSVVLVVATHWHDDHIRGLTQILATCPKARFCLASALCQEGFIALAGALEKRHLSASGSGLRELFGAINLLKTSNAWITHTGKPPSLKHKDRTVARQLRESGVRIRELSERKSLVRARRSSGQEGDWTVEAFGSAGPLVDYAV